VLFGHLLVQFFHRENHHLLDELRDPVLSRSYQRMDSLYRSSEHKLLLRETDSILGYGKGFMMESGSLFIQITAISTVIYRRFMVTIHGWHRQRKMRQLFS
jgi:hypothetical protein